MKKILWFSEIGKANLDQVGGKGANLGELTKADLPVPPGFVVTAEAYFDFLRSNGLDKVIKKLLAGLDYEDSKKLNQVAKAIQDKIMAATMPTTLVNEIERAYRKLVVGFPGGFYVAVRSSATAEDLPNASFAGQQRTFLNMKGPGAVVKATQRCYASLFEARAIYYRAVNNFDHLEVGLAVPVQKMIQSEKSGIMFTMNPVDNNLEVINIEAGWGLGEAIVSGSINPDRYLVSKKDLKIISKEVFKQTWMIKKVGEIDKHIFVDRRYQEMQKLTDGEIIELAKYGVKIEEYYKVPQDTEWAIEKGKIFFVQSRPVTTLKSKIQVPVESAKPGQEGKYIGKEKISSEVLVHGLGASMGGAYGPVKIIMSPAEIDKVKSGDVLVTEMTTPDFVPAMKKAVAIVTDTGGTTSHAAIVSREMGIPCVVGTGTGTVRLKNNQLVTVDGAKGFVYKGKVEVKLAKIEAQKGAKVAGFQTEVPVTATKIYLNLGEPDQAVELAKLPVDGVGLMRAEFIVASAGKHPRALVEEGKGAEYQQIIVRGVKTIAEAFAPRPVVYRATDFKTNEYRNLAGGDKYEPQEANPMIGYRGALRYIKEPDLFQLEMRAIKQVREEYGLENVWVMIPFVRTVSELQKVKQLMAEVGLVQGEDFKLWMMVEVPSNVFLINKFLDEGVDGVSIGSNDLTQLTLGVDRDSEKLAEDFDERDEAVEEALLRVVSATRRRGITCSICGQAPSVYPEVTEFLVKAGITSLSVNSDVVVQTRQLVASVEKKIMLQKIISE